MTVTELLKALQAAPPEAEVVDVKGVMIGLGEGDRSLVTLVDEWPGKDAPLRRPARNGNRGGWPKGKPRGSRKKPPEAAPEAATASDDAH